MSKKIVLVSGASGFIGRHAIPYLRERQFEVHALIHTTTLTEIPANQQHRIDLMNKEATDALLKKIQPSHLLHFAWDVTPGKYWTAASNLEWVARSLILLRAFAEHGGSRVVMAGTCAEYDWDITATDQYDEKLTALAPRSLYGESKKALHALLKSFSEQTKLSYAWGRIFFLFGQHEAAGRLVPQTIASFMKGEAPRCTEGLQRRDFMYVKDVAAGFCALLDSQVQGAVNIASGKAVTVRSLVELMQQQVPQSKSPLYGVIPLAANEPATIEAATERLKSEVGFVPAYSLEEGIRETVAWWRNK